MMPQLTTEARDDLYSIWHHIALRNLDAADRVRDQIEEACQQLADLPLMGHLRDDLAPSGIRFWPVYKYLIIYRRDTEPIRVLRIIHGSRDVPAILEGLSLGNE